MSEVQIALFDVNKLKNKARGQNILIIGDENSKKIELANHLTNQINSSHTKTLWQESFNDLALQELLAKHVNNARAKKYQSLTIVLNDILNVVDYTSVKLTLMNSRRLGITCIIVCDQIKLNELLNTLIDYIFIFAESDKNKMEDIYEKYMCIVPYNLYEPIFTSCTTNDSTVVVDNTVKTKIIQEQVFWYNYNLS